MEPHLSIDEMILDLVAIGRFTLPDPIGHDADGWFLTVTDTWRVSGRVAGHVIYDLCAAEFARQAVWRWNAPGYWERRRIFARAMQSGNSPAAIEALWRALQ